MEDRAPLSPLSTCAAACLTHPRIAIHLAGDAGKTSGMILGQTPLVWAYSPGDEIDGCSLHCKSLLDLERLAQVSKEQLPLFRVHLREVLEPPLNGG